MTEILVAKVAVEKAAYHFDKGYDYLVPPQFTSQIQVGSRVLVPFGAGDGRRLGVVLALERGVCDERIKPLSLLLEQTPLLNEDLLEIACYLKEHTFCTWYDAVKILLPAGAGFIPGRQYRVAADCPAEDALSGQQRAVLGFIRARHGCVGCEKLCEAFGLLPDSPDLKRLLEGGWLVQSDAARRRIGDETVTLARLTGREPSARLTEKQRAVLELLEQVGSASIREVGYYTASTSAVVRALVKKGLVELYEKQVFRGPPKGKGCAPPPITLTGEQQRAYQGLKALCDAAQPAVSLLYGITGSGKTSVFLRLIEDMVATGRQVLVLVPEISLTPQTIEAFTSRYGGRVAILHSALSMGERLDEWRRIRAGRVDIAVGTRSAVFAPFERLGLIIMDEEQEASYKSEASPRYHAREVAKLRCLRHNAQLVLCSATPSVESYYYAKTGRYHLFTLRGRFGAAVLPQVEIVDMDEERRAGNPLAVSQVLGAEIAKNLQEGQQTILLLNRRGYHTLIKCQVCNTAVECPHCSIGLTYHQANGRLLCHYCGYSRALAQRCEVCGSEYVRYAGVGTQRLEEELRQLFPSARVLRMDADTTLNRHAYEDGFAGFAAGRYDIMLGTQMVAKGLNFPNVTLVGVLQADGTLFGDHYKSEERTFSLLTQVVGRSGRGSLAGRAYIQTHFAQNELFSLAARQDYPAFFQREIATRRLMLYPPFCQMCAVGFAGPKEAETARAARDFLQLLTENARARFSGLPLRILGPTPGLVPKVAGKYRYKIIVKGRAGKELRELLSSTLAEAGRAARGLTIYADPYFDGTL